MPKGGFRPGAGRPKGSRDRIWPRGEKRRQAARAQEAALQYLRTNDQAVFDGDSIALMTSVYKNEDMPLPLRIQCAALAAPYERPRLNATDARVLLEQRGLREGAAEGYRERIIAHLDRLAAAHEADPAVTAAKAQLIEDLREARVEELGLVEDREAADATDWIIAQLDKLAAVEERPREAYASEITPTAPARVVVRKRPTPPTIDGECGVEYGVDGAAAVEAAETAPDGRKDAPPSVPEAAASNSQPAPAEDMIEINIPTRSGILTRYVPRTG
jgi:hypothetical protein